MKGDETMLGSKIDGETHKLVLSLRESGMSLAEIAKQTGISISSVHRQLLKYGGENQRREKHATKKEIAQIRELWKQGYAVRDIEAMTRFTERAIRNFIKDLRKDLQENRKSGKIPLLDKLPDVEVPDEPKEIQKVNVEKDRRVYWTYKGSPARGKMPSYECMSCPYPMNKETNNVCGVCYKKIVKSDFI